jgi:hypothetical protein
MCVNNNEENVRLLSDVESTDTLAELASRIDGYGTLVSLEPADWLVCFVPGLKREWWHRLAHAKHQHVFAIRPVGAGNWLLVESWKHRLHVPVLGPRKVQQFLRWGALGDVLRVREHVPGRAWQTRGWSNCAVLTTLVLGRRSWSWTPHGLYRQLLREPGVTSEDVTKLY